MLCFTHCMARRNEVGDLKKSLLLGQAPFTLLRIQVKMDKKAPVFTLRSHCSTVKTDDFDNTLRKWRLLKTQNVM